VGQFEKWHGRPAREITRKMRVPPQTDPLLHSQTTLKSLPAAGILTRPKTSAG